MSSEKSLAIVLRVIEFSETSYVVSLFTRDFGKISALAKGGRRPKGPFESALDLLAVIRIVFLHKSTDSLDLLTEAKLERRFRAATRDLSRLYAGYYLAELLQQLTDEADPHPDLFDAADAALRALDGDADVGATVLRYELTALREVGHLPTLDGCVHCGGEIGEMGRVAFGQQAGGVLCTSCRAGQRHVISLSRDAWQTLKTFAKASVDSQEDTRPKLTMENETHDKSIADNTPLTTIPRHVRGEIRGVMNQYISNLMGHRPRMFGYLGILAN